ncbi:LL-diaminopimelate aminotransferase [Acetivibrio cellulolyticus]|uniref:LL-diaminopimelate aminotransferase n=1 Tax=Acetivibrio cellulolyticus TaxID=35830 RepID=UPI0001E2BA59|nr:LL-diaminopimelate aminotransferase [Acetivibrio cellulolyticus]
MDYIANKISERLGGLSFGKDTGTYKFAVIKEAKAKARRLNPDIALIDMGVGEPDMPANPGVVEVLSKEAGKAENRFYSDNGIQEFYEAAAVYLQKVYGVNHIDPAKNILHGIGSKPILALLPSCFINHGDVTLATVPGYPVIATWTKYLGGEVYNLPLREENSFYPDLDMIPTDVLSKAKLLYINYPNNPTGQVATKEFYKKVIDFAYRHQIIVVADTAYGALTYDGEKPLSFLSVEGAMNVGVEIHSLSKAFNMTGWRMAFVAGNSKVISAYGTVKDNTDSGQFRAIQKAGIYAMNHPELTEETCRKYSRRFDLLVDALNDLGFDAKKPKGTFYCYVKCPKGAGNGVVFETAGKVAKYLIEKALVSVVPWDDAGAYLRFSVTFEAKDEKEEKDIIGEMKKRLGALELVF